MDKTKKRNRPDFRRKCIQLASALLYNANLSGFASGTIYKGDLKGACVPGLNCYSCPGAVAACPLGSLQNALSAMPNKLPLYIVGILLLLGLALGRLICGFLCPFGLIQELLYKIPGKKIKKVKWTRRLSWLKYAVLAVFVVAIPLWYAYAAGYPLPGFCKYICPAGTLEGGIPLVTLQESLRPMLGWLFTWKTALCAAILLLCVFCYRAFCRFLCPLGAIYSFFCRVALLAFRVDEGKCDGCGLCTRKCLMDVKRVGDRECIQCGLCRHTCPRGAIYFGWERNQTHESEKTISDPAADAHTAAGRMPEQQ